MPVYNRFLIENNQIQLNPKSLFINGPILNVEIAVPKALNDLYNKKQLPIPQPKAGFALIDTGATRTCVDRSVIESLDINPVDITTVLTAGGPSQQNLYPAFLRFPGTEIEIEFNSVVSVDLHDQKVNNTPIIALVGRDVLQNFVFIYNGTLGIYTIGH